METSMMKLIRWLDPIHQSVIDKATKLLKEEKKIIQNAFEDGDLDSQVCEYDTAEDYYNSKFKQE